MSKSDNIDVSLLRCALCCLVNNGANRATVKSELRHCDAVVEKAGGYLQSPS